MPACNRSLQPFVHLLCPPAQLVMLIVITPPSCVSQEHSIIRTLFDQGLQRLHVRKPGWSELAIKRYVDAIDPYRQRIVLHSTPQLSASLGVKGMHYSERARPLPPLPSAPAAVADSTVSTSFHSLQQLRTDWEPALSYAFLSPVFDSISKEGYRAACFPPPELHRALEQCPFPVVALGGIKPDNVQEAKCMGFAGVAVIGSVWQARDPLTAWEHLHQAAQEAWVAQTPL